MGICGGHTKYRGFHEINRFKEAGRITDTRSVEGNTPQVTIAAKIGWVQ